MMTAAWGHLCARCGKDRRDPIVGVAPVNTCLCDDCTAALPPLTRQDLDDIAAELYRPRKYDWSAIYVGGPPTELPPQKATRIPPRGIPAGPINYRNVSPPTIRTPKRPEQDVEVRL